MAHARDFGLESADQQAAENLIYDYRDCGFNAADTALCEFAIELTVRPATVTQESLDKLRGNGFSDEQITVATQVIGCFNYLNRIADGLGVDPEEWMVLSAEQWRRQKPSWGN